jgi:beta-glucosidase
VVGDVDTVADILNGHHYTKDVAESSADALKAGTDLCSGRSYTALPDALKRGLVTEADLDTALRRLFLLRFKLGQFDPADRVPYRKIPISENDSSSHSQLALEAARQSLVLLKNDGTLPWDVKTIKTLAVIGPTADSMPALVGNYNGTPSHPVTLLHGLKARLEPQGVHVLVADGAPLVKGFREACKPFPAGVLFTDRQRTQPGLAGEVFSNPDFQGNPSAKRLDAEIDLKWGSFDPLPEVPVKGASIRWTGILVPPVSGDYILSITVKGSARLRMDGKVVIDAWRPGNERTMTAVVPLVAGQSVAIALEFAETMDGGRILLGWKTPADDHELDDALAAARQADHIVLALGLTPQLEGEEMSVHAEGFSGGDRTSILLPASQGQLLSAVAALGKPFTVVLTNGSALSFDISKPNAVLEAWYYGERGGDAITDALLGDTNPGGRLPVTFYRSDSDLPPFVDYSMANRTYRYFRGKPLFAFGYGLSYTTFRYTQLRLSSDTAGASGSVTADVSVTNTGSRAGDEVVELYARAVNPPVPMPLQQLVGFERVPLQPGETKVVELHVLVATLRRWDDGRKAYTVDPGEYELRAGGASDAPAVKSTLRVQ